MATPSKRSSKSIMAEKYLKDSIITQAQALYAVSYPKAHSWSVIIEKSKAASDPANSSLTTYRAHVIVYTSPKTLSQWTPLESTAIPCASEKGALEALLSDLQEGLARLFRREYMYDEETVVGSDEGFEVLGEKRAARVEGSGASAELPTASRPAPVSKSLDEEEIIVDISDDKLEPTISSSSGRFAHDTSAPFAEEPLTATEAHEEPAEDENIHRFNEQHSGASSDSAEQSWSTADERVTDLACESDEEPPAKRSKVLKRRGFGGR